MNIDTCERAIRNRVLNLKTRFDAKGKKLSPAGLRSLEAELAQIEADKKQLEVDKANLVRAFGRDLGYKPGSHEITRKLIC